MLKTIKVVKSKRGMPRRKVQALRLRRLKALQRAELDGFRQQRGARIRALPREVVLWIRSTFSFLVAMALGVLSPASAKASDRKAAYAMKANQGFEPGASATGSGPIGERGDTASARGMASATVVDDIASVRMERDEDDRRMLDITVEEDRRVQMVDDAEDDTTIVVLE